ncbi:MAG TPA: hypothetical protein PLB21_09540, partial [Actinomycetota bacterium]|nr:hypothetical protein [Actinomycetota bacterium]
VSGSLAAGTTARVLEARGLVGGALLVQVGAAPSQTQPRTGMRVVTGWRAEDFALSAVPDPHPVSSGYRP